MDIRIEPSRISGAITPPPFKSYLSRYIMAAALCAGGTTAISGVCLSKDVMAAINFAKGCNARVSVNGVLEITAGSPGFIEFDAIESATVMRIGVLAAAALGGGRICARPSLLSRPDGEFVRLFGGRGIKYLKTGGYVEVGGLRPGVFQVAGDVSSQYLSGLLFALPLLPGDSEIVLTTELKSSQYVDITLETLGAFGVRAHKTSRGYFVPGAQSYRAATLTAPPDWSLAGYFLAMGALTGQVSALGLEFKSVQPDRAVLGALKAMGADVRADERSVRVGKSELRPIELDVSQCPDTAPCVAALMAAAKGVSLITGTRRLKFKESDRAASIALVTEAFGAKARVFDDCVEITGGELERARISSHNDHRIAMLGCVLGSAVGAEIADARAVEKSYPGFFEDFIKMGGLAFEQPGSF